MRKRVLYSALLVLLLVGCQADAPEVPPSAVLPTAVFPPPTPPVATAADPANQLPLPTPTLIPGVQPPEAEQAPATSPTAEGKEVHLVPQSPPAATDSPRQPATTGQYTVGVAPGVPSEIIAAAQATAAVNPDLFSWVGTAGTPDILLTPDGGTPLATWVYAVAAPFATVADNTSAAAVTTGWQTGQSELGSLLVPAESADTLTALFGSPSSAPIAGADLMGEVWAARPSWTLLPFDQLRPEFKTLLVDGVSTLDHAFDPAAYPLTATVGVIGDDAAVAAFISSYTGPTTNRNPERLTRVAMSGVTALVRATAYQMEQNGMLYPGEEVAPVLQSADIAHISNEVSFMPDCPFPDPYGGVTFCSNDRYFELLQSLGIDVIELTGNHVNDYGRQHLVHSLDLYAGAGMDWFGGGRDLADATRAAVFHSQWQPHCLRGLQPGGSGQRLGHGRCRRIAALWAGVSGTNQPTA